MTGLTGETKEGPLLHMAYCGTVTLQDERGQALHTWRYGTMPDGDPTRLAGQLAQDVLAILACQPDLQMGLLCNVAPEMWNLLEEEFNQPPFNLRDMNIFRLIDFCHVIEKLAPAAKLIAGNEGEAKPLLARWRLLLRNSSFAREKVLTELLESGIEDEWMQHSPNKRHAQDRIHTPLSHRVREPTAPARPPMYLSPQCACPVP